MKDAAMELVLWRHADAEDAAPGKVDGDRRLTPKGARQAERMAAWLKERLPRDAVVVVSPARRAQQTARHLTEKYQTSEAVGTGADVRQLLDAAGWPHRGGTVVVVGHQPTLGQALALALTGRAAEWGIKKGAIVWLAWRDRGDGPPAQLRAVLSPDLLKE
jgi:phosphohistidine phosphatase